MQEIRAQETQLPKELFYPNNYHCQYVPASKKGYSGVAIYSKYPPQNVQTKLGWEVADNEGRYLQFDFANFSVASLYLPSGSSGEARQRIKFDFLDRLEVHLANLAKQGRHYILCGDWNIAHKNIDLENWRGNQKNSGFLPEERAWMDQLLGPWGFVDAFRICNQSPQQYTWWSNRGRAWKRMSDGASIIKL